MSSDLNLKKATVIPMPQIGWLDFFWRVGTRFVGKFLPHDLSFWPLQGPSRWRVESLNPQSEPLKKNRQVNGTMTAVLNTAAAQTF